MRVCMRRTECVFSCPCPWQTCTAISAMQLVYQSSPNLASKSVSSEVWMGICLYVCMSCLTSETLHTHAPRRWGTLTVWQSYVLGRSHQSIWYNFIIRNWCFILPFEILLYLKALIGEAAVAIATLPSPNLYMVVRQTRQCVLKMAEWWYTFDVIYCH